MREQGHPNVFRHRFGFLVIVVEIDISRGPFCTKTRTLPKLFIEGEAFGPDLIDPGPHDGGILEIRLRQIVDIHVDQCDPPVLEVQVRRQDPGYLGPTTHEPNRNDRVVDVPGAVRL